MFGHNDSLNKIVVRDSAAIYVLFFVYYYIKHESIFLHFTFLGHFETNLPIHCKINTLSSLPGVEGLKL